MKDSTHFGMNKTGVKMSPRLSQSMTLGTEEFPAKSVDASVDPVQLRQDYARESHQLGTTPLPGTAKGAITAGIQKIMGRHPEVVFDKLGERLAFERTGVRLYDALITKSEAVLPNANLEMLRKFRDEEAQHFEMLRDAIENLGGDPTAQTPCADSSGVASLGLTQVLNDPRSSIPQCVEAILIAELTDNDGWDVLIHLMREANQTDLLRQFNQAKAEEESHLMHMRTWIRDLVLENRGVPLQ